MSTTTDELPEYAVTIAHCGDPQPVIGELTEWLDEQTAPQSMTPEGEVEPGEGDDEGEPVGNDPAEDAETDETSGGRG